MEVWETAKSMGFTKCAAMLSQFILRKFEPGADIITEGQQGAVHSRSRALDPFDL